METRFPAGLSEWLISLAMPPKCLCCPRRIPADRLFCPKCEKKLPKKAGRRSIELPDGSGLTVLAPLPYEGGYRDSMLIFKFQKGRYMGLRMGTLMAGLLRELPRQMWTVTYVPISEEGFFTRGYDQSFLLARQVARLNGLELVRLLDKVKVTRVQHELALEDRRTNLLGAYKASKEAAGRDILLIDDIVTSGSTLKECARVLKKAGARSVYGLCAAGCGDRAEAEPQAADEGALLEID